MYSGVERMTTSAKWETPRTGRSNICGELNGNITADSKPVATSAIIVSWIVAMDSGTA